MLPVRPPLRLENEIAACSAQHQVSTSHVGKDVLAERLAANKAREATNAEPVPEHALSNLPANDPLRKGIDFMTGGPSTGEWVRFKRGDDLNQP